MHQHHQRLLWKSVSKDEILDLVFSYSGGKGGCGQRQEFYQQTLKNICMHHWPSTRRHTKESGKSQLTNHEHIRNLCGVLVGEVPLTQRTFRF